MRSIFAMAIVSTFFASCTSKNKIEAPYTPTPTVQEQALVSPTKEKPTTKKTGVKKSQMAKTDSSASSSAAAGDATCKAGSDERKLAVTPKDQGCELQYTKAGETSVIASQIIGNEKCETVQATVKEKLIAAGFSCE